jgi:DNA polymerase-4
MSLRLVQVLSPHSHFMPAAHTRYSQVSSEVIDVLVDFSPLIEPQELWHPFTDISQHISSNGRNLPARYCLDLEGLPEGEAHSFIQEIGKSVRRETDLEPAIGLASHKFTAQVAATVCHVNHALPVKPGKDESFLASRSLSFLPLERDMARRLSLLGIRTFGQLTGLALPALHEQFGPQIIPIYKLARLARQKIELDFGDGRRHDSTTRSDLTPAGG